MRVSRSVPRLSQVRMAQVEGIDAVTHTLHEAFGRYTLSLARRAQALDPPEFVVLALCSIVQDR